MFHSQEIQGIYKKGGAGENIANLIKYILERKKIWERYSPWGLSSFG